MAILGHKTVQMTKRYSHLSDRVNIGGGKERIEINLIDENLGLS